ncbi:MAG: preprotein translocase subunit SecE [Bacteroidales bacterium]|nr:preprotein translocase subunit SecE [Bacteroidales bacterium]MBR4438279.1 preprotein translocase subunit SecE [Bacteroidales bacterium]MBR4805246.1 preprotein translocase subunit SecE [Bacteroidales bacterium]MBR4980339.1 preprotein translocase subunit SecE [Bacteroidales bacterium]MBR5907136.1 preprotein translocase subunit SecE [Bacteroidales bacterium]
MSKVGTYIKESYKELTKKVSWPTWSQLQSSAAVVMVATVIFAVLVFVMDLAFKNLMTGIYRLLQ